MKIKCAYLESEDESDSNQDELFIRFSDFMLVLNMMKMNFEHYVENEDSFYLEDDMRGKVLDEFLSHLISYLAKWREDEG